MTELEEKIKRLQASIWSAKDALRIGSYLNDDERKALIVGARKEINELNEIKDLMRIKNIK